MRNLLKISQCNIRYDIVIMESGAAAKRLP
jgi:hypothetical protein